MCVCVYECECECLWVFVCKMADIRCRWFPVASVWQATSSCLSSCTSPPQFHQFTLMKAVTHSFLPLNATQDRIIQQTQTKKISDSSFLGRAVVFRNWSRSVITRTRLMSPHPHVSGCFVRSNRLEDQREAAAFSLGPISHSRKTIDRLGFIQSCRLFKFDVDMADVCTGLFKWQQKVACKRQTMSDK